MAKLLNDERETHINMIHGSSKMRIYTTEYNIMKKLDRYVEHNDNWKIVEVGMVHGEVVSKTYEAPKDLLLIREKKRMLTEQQRADAAARLKAYHAAKQMTTKWMWLISVQMTVTRMKITKKRQKKMMLKRSHLPLMLLPMLQMLEQQITKHRDLSRRNYGLNI